MRLSSYTVTQSRLIPAAPDVCYDILADYREGHPSILPPRWFGPLTVEEGGVGAGTRIRFEMKVLGKTNVGHATITEPVPGRVLVETDAQAGVVTTFVVERVGAVGSRVTFETEMTSRGGWLRGLVERVVVPPLLRRIYTEELALLDERAAERLERDDAAAAAAATAPISMGRLPTAPVPVS